MKNNIKENESQSKPQKPLVILRQECLDSIVKTINNSGLPAFIIESMLRDLLTETQGAVRREYELSLKFYEKQCGYDYSAHKEDL